MGKENKGRGWHGEEKGEGGNRLGGYDERIRTWVENEFLGRRDGDERARGKGRDV